MTSNVRLKSEESLAIARALKLSIFDYRIKLNFP